MMMLVTDYQHPRGPADILENVGQPFDGSPGRADILTDKPDAIGCRDLHHVMAGYRGKLLRPLGHYGSPRSDDNDAVDLTGLQEILRDYARDFCLAGTRSRIDDEMAAILIVAEVVDALFAGRLLPVTKLHGLVAFENIAIGAECLPVEESCGSAEAKGRAMVGVEIRRQRTAARSAPASTSHHQDKSLPTAETALQGLTQYSVSVIS